MRRWLFVLPLLVGSQAFAQQAVPTINFESVPNPLKLPTNMYFGEVSGVAVNSKGHVFALSRGNTSGPAYAAAATQLLEFDKDGKFIREIGKNLYAWSFAHTVKIDPSDNIWVTDKGSDMVIKFDTEGRVLMVFGRKQEASDEDTEPLKHPKPPLPPDDGRFRQVTDVAWDKAGDTFISDGYINSRVGKVDKDGNWLKSWGEPGNGPGQLNTPHSIATDANDNVYVADRSNNRIQVFDSDGQYLRSILLNAPYDKKRHPVLGTPRANPPDATQPWTICITNTTPQYLYTSDEEPGRIYKLSLDGKILGMLGESGHEAGQFNWIHAIACVSENTLLVADMNNWRIQKVTLHPEKAKLASASSDQR